MFAIIETGGKQYRVEKGHTILVDRLAEEEGAKITIDQVLLVGGDEVKVGTPTVKGCQGHRHGAGAPHGQEGDHLQVQAAQAHAQAPWFSALPHRARDHRYQGIGGSNGS